MSDKSKVIFVNLILLVSILLLIETVSWVFLNAKNQAQPFLVNVNSNLLNNKAPDEFQILRYLDPLLGWAQDPSAIDEAIDYENGFAHWGHKSPDESFRVMVTGGSTSDSTSLRMSWARVAQKKLAKQGYCVRFSVGAVPGYNSSQELLKTLRDAPKLNPHLHISYSGTNEASDPNWNNFSTIYYHHLLEKLVNHETSFLMPNFVKAVSGDNKKQKGALYGLEPGLPQIANRGLRWEKNMRSMRALSKEFGYNFIGILQPTLGHGKYNMSERDLEIVNNVPDKELWSELYSSAKKATRNNSFLYNFTDIFEGKSDIFVDDCHVTEEGHRIIGEAVYDLIIKKFKNQLERKKTCIN